MVTELEMSKNKSSASRVFRLSLSRAKAMTLQSSNSDVVSDSSVSTIDMKMSEQKFLQGLRHNKYFEIKTAQSLFLTKEKLPLDNGLFFQTR